MGLMKDVYATKYRLESFLFRKVLPVSFALLLFPAAAPQRDMPFERDTPEKIQTVKNSAGVDLLEESDQIEASEPVLTEIVGSNGAETAIAEESPGSAKEVTEETFQEEPAYEHQAAEEFPPEVIAKEVQKKNLYYNPEIAFSLFPSFPIGYLGNIFSSGLGASLEGSIGLARIFDELDLENPLERKWLSWRGGATLGYYGYTTSKSNYEAKIFFVPVTIDLRGIFTLELLRQYNLYPYTEVGSGVSFASSTRSEGNLSSKASSIDFTARISGGLFWKISGLENLHLFLEGEYLIALETENAHILNLSPGVEYEL